MSTADVSTTTPAAEPGMPGATLAFFTDLRAIIVDETQPLGNRLQNVDARICLLTGAPQPVEPYRQPEEIEDERSTLEQILQRKAHYLVDLAAAAGYVLTIERRPRQPLAMGNYDLEVSVWPKRA